MRSLSVKLTLAFLIVSLAGVLLVASFVWFSTGSQFDQFLVDRAEAEFVSFAENYYAVNGTWNGIAQSWQEGRAIHARDNGGPPPVLALADGNNQIVMTGGRYRLGDVVSGRDINQGIAITINNQRVGTVIHTGSPPVRDALEQQFLVKTNWALVYAALGAAMIAVGLGALLARTITKPVRELTTAAHAMAKGQLKQRVVVRSQDELGELTSTFNQMSADLERANALRRQMTADIAHDLRTPLTVISGYLEALRDGKLRPTPERFDTLYGEARMLQRLVDDLRTLSLADAGELAIQRQRAQPVELLQSVATAFEHQAAQRNIRLIVDIAAEVAAIAVDSERITQVLGNLVSNALRYTPDNGEIRLAARSQQGQVFLSVQDNGAGILPDILPHVFDRFYRGDESRQGDESGLGLAIAKAIVELHGGKISAASAGAGKGATFTIQLPAV